MRFHKGFTIKELIVLIIMIALFVIGFKFGSGLVNEKLVHYKNEFWFLWLLFTGGIVSGILPVAIFIFLFFCIGMFMDKRKKK